ncbi:hypothetical protein PsAD2_00349 [Pseudovibrio axinellae]|uniref:Winged helix DNA-binding domain-containing protein n=1 Tax=Pseudovibrio axinellae TaxID=989403 RepID=A0A166AYR9_9HYPH|nr:crosslink repair DNA glycosylase YcaQ family protein [Pseudovibrio axinellae]KZL21726.1 hypothetical protein PsAD2_00349 [Pseudovibrio axinellae]SEQ21071.1 hypothetical protein SAMN05421798_102141 [Pseudovibrio axinellae]
MKAQLVLKVDNIAARRLFLQKHALLESPNGASKGEDLLTLIKRIGFVQVDSINTVERAHHMILWSRRQNYRPPNLAQLLEKDRSLFEHWTHDASIIPTEFFPHWHYRFKQSAESLQSRWKVWRGAEYQEKLNLILRQIEENGPAGTSDVGKDEKRSKGGWWEWNPSKTALEYLWRTGHISVSRREKFQKLYDLTERVIPPAHRSVKPTKEDTVEWACSSALERLGFATPSEIAAYWDKLSLTDVKAWCEQAQTRQELIPVEIEAANQGKAKLCFARPQIETDLSALGNPAQRVRILSPFDPALRDRKRAEFLFDFNYRIEIFVPEAKRQYGYYVFPVMEGDKLIGRIDMKRDKASSALVVKRFWPEPGVRMGKGRINRLTCELERCAQFAGCSDQVVSHTDLTSDH